MQNTRYNLNIHTDPGQGQASPGHTQGRQLRERVALQGASRLIPQAEVEEADSQVGQVDEVAGLQDESVEQQAEGRDHEDHDAEEQQLLTPP